ncbi:MAG: NFACT family protein, partial [Deltaproteobacteria bacterium]|nr:NFACT family protein [Deltaproteobacteria bacterium]
MDIQLLNRIIYELKPELIHGIISNVHQMDERHIILKIFFRGKDNRLLISIQPRFFRIHLTEKRYENPPSPLRFCAYLRSHLINQRIEDINILSGERIVNILFKDSTLAIELTGRDSNVILIDKNGIILDAMRYFPPEDDYPRPVKPGLQYMPLHITAKPLPGIDIPKGDYPSYNSAADAYYAELAETEEFSLEKANLMRIITDTRKKLKRKLENLTNDKDRAEKNLRLSLYGELLLANFSNIKKGMKEVDVFDYYQDPPQKITIPLDPALSPQENIDKIFKRVKKAKTAIELLKERMPSVEDEIKYLEEISFQSDTAENQDDLSAIRETLSLAGYIKKQGHGSRVMGQGKSKTEPIRRFKSSDGCEILCGKTAAANDLLVKKYARDYDLWFHAYGAAGSHALLRLKNKNDEPSQNSILEAGAIAAFFSKAKNETKAEVAYTLAKNVKKPKGAKPGLVTITN